MKFFLANITGFSLIMILVLPFALAQDSYDYLQELNSLRDPFLPQLPQPKVVPVVPVVAPRNPDVSTPVQAVVQPAQLIQTIPNPSAVKVQSGRNNTEGLVVKGVVWNTQIPQAIINDKVVRIGDFVSGMEIVAIRSKGVEVLNNGVATMINLTDQNKR